MASRRSCRKRSPSPDEIRKARKLEEKQDSTPSDTLPPCQSDALPLCIQQLEKLFSTTPQFEEADGHTRSTGTRPPKYFDLHLREDLQLKHVIVCEELPERFAEFLMKKLQTKVADERSSTEFRPTDLLCVKENRVVMVLDEDGIVCHAEDHLFKQCATAASIICFGFIPESETNAILKTEKRDSRGVANADLLLCVDKGPVASAILEDDTMKEGIEFMSRYGLTKPVVTEFKSLVSGSEEVMDKVVNSPWEGWTRCDPAGSKCKSKQHFQPGGELTVTGKDFQLGPDLDLCDFLDDTSLQKLLALSLDESDDDSAAPLDGDCNTETECSEIEYEDSQPQYSDILDEKKKCLNCAHSIRQQLWATMAKENATFAMINCGHCMNIVLRHRKTGTMLISPAISAQKPLYGFGLLITSVFVAGVEDALIRAKQMQQQNIPSIQEIKENAKSFLASNPTKLPKFSDENRKRLAETPFVYVKLGGIVPPSSIVKSVNMSRDKPCHVVQYAKFERVHLDPLVDVMHMASPSLHDSGGAPCVSVSKAQPPNDAPPTQGENQVNDLHNVFYFDSRLASSNLTSNSRVWCVKAMNHLKQQFPRTFVIKLAVTERDFIRLEREYRAYLALRSRGNVAPHLIQTYGFFTHQPRAAGTLYAILLMEHGGDSLSISLERPVQWTGHISPMIVKERVMNTLKCLHLEGYLHTAVEPSHFLINPVTPSSSDAKTFLIGLSNIKYIGKHDRKVCLECKGRSPRVSDSANAPCKSRTANAFSEERRRLLEWL